MMKDILVRFDESNNEVRVIAQALAEKMYKKMASRLADHLGEGEEFIASVAACDNEYVEYEVKVSKELYMLDETRFIAEARKGLTQRVYNDVMDNAQCWIDRRGNRKGIKNLPDDLETMFEESLPVHCRPGSENNFMRIVQCLAEHGYLDSAIIIS